MDSNSNSKQFFGKKYELYFSQSQLLYNEGMPVVNWVQYLILTYLKYLSSYVVISLMCFYDNTYIKVYDVKISISYSIQIAIFHAMSNHDGNKLWWLQGLNLNYRTRTISGRSRLVAAPP